MTCRNNTPFNRALYLPLAVAAAGLIIWWVAFFTKEQHLNRLRQIGASRVSFYAGSLQDSLERYRHLPYVLVRDARIRALLKAEIKPIRVNPHLEDYAHAAGALIYVLDAEGTTVATSNWRDPASLLGHNYSFRPYFRDAISGQPGGYYTVGLQTRKPGFFLSYPVLDVGKAIGVVVVKIDLTGLQNMWQEGGESIIVSDAYGVIFMTSNSNWLYKSLRDLPLRTATRLRQTQYLEQGLETLDVLRQTTRQGNILTLEDRRFLEQSRQLPDYGWRIHYLTDMQIINNSVVTSSIVTAFTILLATLVLLYLRERRHKLLSRQQAREAEAVKALNERLKEEILQHQLTEEDLRRTQRELLQAGKLAALGRMSAAIAHELNQPVTAIRTFTASCGKFVERQQPIKVQENLSLIAKLTDRMADITGQLKTFARKSKGSLESVDMVMIIKRVLRFMTPTLDRNGIRVITSLPEPGIVMVTGNVIQLEQVITNLIQNGLDAMQSVEIRSLTILVERKKAEVTIDILDTGCGIAGQAMDSLFDPFFTTKEIGEGLGLGLSIIYGIIEDMQGTIHAENRDGGGARFSIELPLAKEGQPTSASTTGP